MGLFEDLFGSSDEPEPTLTIEQETRKPKLPRKKGRKPRGLNLDEDFELKNKQTTAGKGIDALQESGKLDPADIEKIASNLEGQGARKNDLIDDLVDELLKGNTIDYKSLDDKQKKELRTRLQERPAPTTKKDFQSGTMKGDLATDIQDGVNTDLLNPQQPSVTEPSVTEPKIPSGEAPFPATPPQFLNNDLETTQEHHEVTESATIQDQSLDFQHIGGSRTNFDNNFIGFVLQQFFKKSLNVLASRTTGLDEEWTNLVIEPAVNKAPELYRLLRDGLTSDYGRLDIHDKNQPLTAPTLPLIIIILYLYVVDRSDDFKIDFNFIEGFFIKKVLKDYFNFNNELVNYGMDIINNIPNELATAYRKQKGTQENMITANEVNAISKLVQYINIEYSKRFNKNLANELFTFENKQSLYLYEMLETLGSSSTLFQISSGFNTINNLITEMVSNPYLLVQLIALIYNENENKNLASSDVLSRGKVDKYIYYYSDLNGGVKEDLKVSILKNIQLDMNDRGKVKGMSVIENNDKVALYNYKGRYYLAFRGTDKKDEKDIRSNFLNFGGKDLLNNPEYDERIKTGKRYLDLAIMKSRQEGLEPPAILGYSLGGVSAMYLSTLYPNIETDVYAPILSKSELTENIMEYLGNSNIHFNYSEKDPISSNMEYYRKKYPNLDINKYRNNKFFSPHDLGQFI